jgi:hypothetical protein
MDDSRDLAALPVEELVALVEQKEQGIADRDASLAEANTIIDELKTQLTAQQAQPSDVPVIMVGKDQYRVTAPRFQFEGEEYSVQQLLANKKMQEALVKKGAGFLEKIQK